MVRFQRQPPGTAVTRTSLIAGAMLAALAAVLIVAREPRIAGLVAGVSAVLQLVGGHRANHGAGGPVDRMLAELGDRAWDATILGAIAWVARIDAPHVSAGALVALCFSYLSSYVRARGAALGYSIEESHVTRGLRYGLIVLGLTFDQVGWTVWAAAVVSVLAAFVRTVQVAQEERA